MSDLPRPNSVGQLNRGPTIYVEDYPLTRCLGSARDLPREIGSARALRSRQLSPWLRLRLAAAHSCARIVSLLLSGLRRNERILALEPDHTGPYVITSRYRPPPMSLEEMTILARRTGMPVADRDGREVWP